MNTKETAQVFALLYAYYPQSAQGQTDAARRFAIEAWQQAFADEPAELVMKAVQAYVCTATSSFFPIPGQIKEQIRLLLKKEELTEQDAWDLVLKALRNSSYGAAEEYAKLPDVVKRAVGSHNMLKQWVLCDAGELQYIAMDFKKTYRAILNNEQNKAKLPAAVAALCEGTQKLIE